MAIQAPGISKPCGVCKRRYLTPEYLAGIDDDHVGLENNGDNSAPFNAEDLRHGDSVSLVQLLLHTIDACIYCGGKFIG